MHPPRRADLSAQGRTQSATERPAWDRTAQAMQRTERKVHAHAQGRLQLEVTGSSRNAWPCDLWLQRPPLRCARSSSSPAPGPAQAHTTPTAGTGHGGKPAILSARVPHAPLASLVAECLACQHPTRQKARLADIETQLRHRVNDDARGHDQGTGCGEHDVAPRQGGSIAQVLCLPHLVGVRRLPEGAPPYAT
jgi:hypothetical protein